jgi:2,4-dienoyl-CoA reductase-like NADH-dependent reductase (Old Yellow Enzyme family)/thioredoxin reductase
MTVSTAIKPPAYPHLFQPLKIGPLTLKNRILATPAAPWLTSHSGGITSEFYAYTNSVASSGIASMVTGVSTADPEPHGGARILTAGRDDYLPDLAEVADSMHAGGAAASIELISTRYMLTKPEALVNDLSVEEVEDIIAIHAAAVTRALKAGFDMVTLHGGHGNVPALFNNKKYNHRTDRFGSSGSAVGRARFAVELLEAVNEAADGKLAIEWRISAEEMLPDMTTFEEMIVYAHAVQHLIHLLHVSRGLLSVDALLPYINAPLYLPRGLNLPFAERFKQELDVPVTVVGAFNLELAEQAVASGKVDAVSMIRTLYADTSCVEKARRGDVSSIRPCIRCNTCIDRTHTDRVYVQCAVNPLLGRETRFPRGLALNPKRVVIIGAGPAGLEAARTCADRGHTVTIYEKNAEAGGLLRLASGTQLKQELRDYLEWSIRDVQARDNVEIKLGVEATPETIRALTPDVLFLATGAVPIIPTFTASGTEKIVWAGDVETDADNDAIELGKKIVVVGAGMTGMELALELINKGKDVTLVDMLSPEKIGAGGTVINLIALRSLLSEGNAQFVLESRVIDIDSEGVHVRKSDDSTQLLPCDTAVLSLGFRIDETAAEPFAAAAPEVYRIGDCSTRGGTLHKVIRSAFETSMRL